MSDVISLCLDCKHFSHKARPIARKNDGDIHVTEGRSNWCTKHDADLIMIGSTVEEMKPDVAECVSYESN